MDIIHLLDLILLNSSIKFISTNINIERHKNNMFDAATDNGKAKPRRINNVCLILKMNNLFINI